MPSKNYYLYPYLIILIGTFSWWLSMDHGDAVLWMNNHRSQVFDFFFKYWTYLGDGIIVAVFFLILLLWKWRLAVVFLANGLAQFLISQGLKRFVFHNVPRPIKFFEDIAELHLIEGIKHHSSHSFPSGHTITAFATATFFAILFRKNKYLSVAILIAAILVGISRIYLLQHFLRDVMAGSLIGVIIAISVYRLFDGFLKKGKLSEH